MWKVLADDYCHKFTCLASLLREVTLNNITSCTKEVPQGLSPVQDHVESAKALMKTDSVETTEGTENGEKGPRWVNNYKLSI